MLRLQKEVGCAEGLGAVYHLTQVGRTPHQTCPSLVAYYLHVYSSMHNPFENMAGRTSGEGNQSARKREGHQNAKELIEFRMIKAVG